MKLQVFAILALSFSLGGCNDVSSNRQKAPNEINTPAIEGGTTPLLISSGMIRNLGAATLSNRQESSSVFTNNPEYRTVPNMETDDEGQNERSVRTRQYLTRPKVECGLADSQSLNSRINHCAKLNGSRATWDGRYHGSSTEGRWDLVALQLSGVSTKEIWIDRKSGLLWSDIYGPTNWCEASGNEQPDVRDLHKINCEELMVESRCVGQNLLSISKFDWRLPTRNDYLQADLDGLRFVLKAGNGTGFWTATLSTLGALREKAWVYNSDKSGILVSEEMTELRQVRCIGIVAK